MKSKKKSNENKLDKKNTKIVHENSKCSKCGMSPIEGIRYLCLKCFTFELCQKCEKKYGEKHGHQLLMLRRPEDLEKFKSYIFKKESENIIKIEDKKETKIDLTKCYSKCINLKSIYTTKNNNNFIPIEITLKNTGDEQWPYPSFFSCEDESEVKGKRVKLAKCTGKPGEEFTLKIKIILNNIKKTGIYKSIWRLKNENGDAFGERIEFIIKDLFEKDLNIKKEEKKNNEDSNEAKDYRDKLEENIKEIKQKFYFLFSTDSIRNALIRTKGNKENAIKILNTEQKKGKYNQF